MYFLFFLVLYYSAIFFLVALQWSGATTLNDIQHNATQHKGPIEIHDYAQVRICTVTAKAISVQQVGLEDPRALSMLN
jgi:hypothetical protein